MLTGSPGYIGRAYADLCACVLKFRNIHLRTTQAAIYIVQGIPLPRSTGQAGGTGTNSTGGHEGWGPKPAGMGVEPRCGVKQS